MSFAQTIAGVYIRGNSFEIRPDRTAFRVRGKELPPPLAEAVREHKSKILSMLVGDPLSGPGWEGRTVLWKSAMFWLDAKVAEMGIHDERGKEHVFRALYADTERLNTAWIDSEGDFEAFRGALREHVGKGLEAVHRFSGASGEARVPHKQGSLEFSA